MDHDQRQELANDLRRMADLLESLPIGTALRAKVNVYFHQVTELKELQAVTHGCASLRREHAPKSGPWIRGHFGNIDVAAFYLAGILGECKRRKVTVVEYDDEVTVDLSLLS